MRTVLCFCTIYGYPAIYRTPATVAATPTVIQENVKHHIGEEEEKIFAQMQQMMSSGDLSNLGSRYEEVKRSALPVAAR
ncbi:hypothetical protein [Methanoculleus sp.]|jgi:hypothetical protein|uniref:hypothetical protein n=1 Tax=Methanoculleus sp. TaxID=90427 RepID=UPI0026046468|nr:hypothetical protein [Methanoculleus sp.]